MVSQKIILVITFGGLLLGIPSAILALNEFGIISIGENGHITIEEVINPPYKPPNPSVEIFEDHGFQISLTDSEDWEKYEYDYVTPSKTFEIKDFFLNREGKIISLDHLDPSIRYASGLEIFVYHPNDMTIEENIREFVKKSNKKFSAIQTELESDVVGIWFLYNGCSKWDQKNCKQVSWIKLHKSEEKLYILHNWIEYDNNENPELNTHDEYKFVMNSFRTF